MYNNHHHHHYLKMALEYAKISKAKKRQVGVLAVDYTGRIRCSGTNGTISGTGPQTCEDGHGETLSSVVHAEVNMIAHAASWGISLQGCEVYCTHLPCLQCAKLLAQVGIVRVIYLCRSGTGNDQIFRESHIVVERGSIEGSTMEDTLGDDNE